MQGGDEAVNNEEFAIRVESVRMKLYRTELIYLENETLAMDAVDERRLPRI